MGLLTDTYSDIINKLQGINLRSDDDISGMDSDFNDSAIFLRGWIHTNLKNRKQKQKNIVRKK